MTALFIILGIILFFVLLLSIPVFLELQYTDSVSVTLSWLFLKFKLYPGNKEKKKKEKPQKEAPKEEEKKEEEPKKEEPKPKKENFLKTFYNYQGVSGITELIRDCAAALGKFSKGFLKSIYIRKLRIDIRVTESDAAQTALKYGKICGEIYPPLGFICSSCHVKNYKVNILADYCGEKTKGEFETKVGLVPRSVMNAGIALVVRLGVQLLKVAVSNIKSANKEAAAKANANPNKKGGQNK